MGILSSLNKLVTKNPIVKTIVSPVPNLIQRILPNPVTKFMTEKPVTTALLVAGGAVGTLTKVGAAVVTPIAKSLIPTTAKGALVGGATTLVVGSALTQTKKPLELVSKAPGALINFGKDAGKLIEDPSLSNAERLLKENPGVSVALGTGALLLGGAAVAKTLLPAAGAVTNIQTKKSIDELTETIQLPNTSPGVILPSQKPITTEQTPFSPPTAITPATANLPQTTTSSTGVRRRNRKSMRSPSNINQRVNVIVQNKNYSVGSKNYLNRRILV